MESLGTSRITESNTIKDVPSDWLSTAGLAKDGQSAAVEYRSGTRGAWMLVQVFDVHVPAGEGVQQALYLLVEEAWGAALAHRGDRPDSGKMFYRMRLLPLDGEMETGGAVTDPIVIGKDEAGGDIFDQMVGGDGRELAFAWSAARMLFNENYRLVRANCEMAERVATMNDKSMERHAQFFQLKEEFAARMLQAERERIQDEADAVEQREMWRTGREWLRMANESKMVERGIKVPKVPRKRKDAARALFESLNMKQMRAIQKSLGEDKGGDLLQLFENMAEMEDEEIETLIEQLKAGGMLDPIKIHALAEDVFSAKYVPGPYAVWQQRALSMVLEGPIDLGEDDDGDEQ